MNLGTQESERDMNKLKEKVFQTIGTASMCWIPRPDDMIFDSTLAEQIGEELWSTIEQENAKLKAELEKSQCMLAGFMVAEDQEKAELKERVALLEKVREAAQETYQVLCIEYGYRKAEVNFGYLSKALKNCEASDDKIRV